MDIEKVIKSIKFNEKGWVPVVTQDVDTKKVLMLAYMNEEAIKKTLEEKIAHYYSRSRQKLWKKGETSGNIQKVKGFYYDCDKDSILLLVKQVGVACHTGNYSCFYNEVFKEEDDTNEVVKDLYQLIKHRKKNPKEGSYTSYLFENGIDKILKKVGEEASEVIIGAKNHDKENIIYEIGDLVYHVLVLMVEENVEIKDIKNELYKRNTKQ